MNNNDAAIERFLIHELIGRYVDALNHRDWSNYRELWVDDSSLYTILESQPEAAAKQTEGPTLRSVRLNGIGEIMEMVRRYNDISWLFQLPHGIVVELESDRKATARHSLHIIGQHFTMIGICYDRFEKCPDGMWRFVHRDYRPSYCEAAEATGFVMRRLPNPDYRSILDVHDDAGRAADR